MSSSQCELTVQRAPRREDLDNAVKGAHNIIVDNVKGFELIGNGNFRAFEFIAALSPQLMSQTTNEKTTRNALPISSVAPAISRKITDMPSSSRTNKFLL
jgi:hypothetical protein